MYRWCSKLTLAFLQAFLARRASAWASANAAGSPVPTSAFMRLVATEYHEVAAHTCSLGDLFVFHKHSLGQRVGTRRPQSRPLVLGLQRIGCRKLPVLVRLGAWPATIQFTRFPTSGSTSLASNGQCLGLGEEKWLQRTAGEASPVLSRTSRSSAWIAFWR
jgi:hypothetical protein